jgi:hypothetical protein
MLRVEKKMKWTLEGNSWKLSEVDSIPNTATRTNMSHFSYQLRHTNEKGKRWAKKVDELLIKARDVHTNPKSGQVWNFRIHIIEVIDARCVQPLERTSALLSRLYCIDLLVYPDQYTQLYSYPFSSVQAKVSSTVSSDTTLGLVSPSRVIPSHVWH